MLQGRPFTTAQWRSALLRRSRHGRLPGCGVSLIIQGWRLSPGPEYKAQGACGSWIVGALNSRRSPLRRDRRSASTSRTDEPHPAFTSGIEVPAPWQSGRPVGGRSGHSPRARRCINIRSCGAAAGSYPGLPSARRSEEISITAYGPPLRAPLPDGQGFAPASAGLDVLRRSSWSSRSTDRRNRCPTVDA